MLIPLKTSSALDKSGGTYPRPLEDSQVLHHDTSGLISELRASVKGEVRFDDGSRALYSTDGSNYRQIPLGVVCPRDIDDVVTTTAACRKHKLPLLSRGGGTSLAGQCCNTAVVMDMSKYMYRIIGIEPNRKLARVEPGCVLDRLRDEAKKSKLTFGPDPATHNHCTLGGMVGNNSCGIHAQMAGRTADNIEELEILTYDGLRMRVGKTSDSQLNSIIAEGGRRGDIYRKLRDLRDRYADLIRTRYPKIPRRVSGYNLDELLPERGFHVARALVGSEGTCVTVLEVVTNLVHNPPERCLLVLGYPDVFQAGDHVPQVVSHKPIGCEGLDERLLGYYERKGKNPRKIALLPDGNGWLLVEFGGESKQEAEDRARGLMEDLTKSPNPPKMKLFSEHEKAEMIWELREGGLGATAFVPGQRDAWPGWEDSAVPPDQVGPYLRELRKLFEKHGYDPAVYGHFGQGCIHCRVQFDLATKEGLANYKSFLDEATDLVVRFGGSFSGEHGDGQARAEYLPKMFGDELIQSFREFKSIWDPDWMMNPGKVVDPYPVDTNLRLGTTYNPPQPNTHFHYQADDFRFSKATLRCVGVGKCRRESGGTMCPSYMVTREEMHSTRGRTHLLFEMLEGNPLSGGWRDPHVHEALDLCLSCKGCKGDCPVSVDVATYKAEFLSHYYEGRIRPRHMYASGLIHWAARVASLMPATANFFTQTPGFSNLLKLAAGFAQQRSIPPFAPETFRHWFGRREKRNVDGPPVMLWPDTFNNFFTPEIGKAAVEVLEHAGFQVQIPDATLCCGRPLYDYGMLDLAKRVLLKTLGGLRPTIIDGVPLIGLEPSCVSVFREEMPNLLYGNHDAERLMGNTFLLSEFLDKHANGYTPPPFKRRVLLHGHCHQKSVLNFQQGIELLEKCGLDLDIPESGCCGMAGSFGYEEEHYETGLKCGERVLLPSVRSASEETIIVTDGFSCREMIQQETGRQPLHTAQVLQMAIHENESGPQPARLPETESPAVLPTPAVPLTIAVASGAVLLGGAYLLGKRLRNSDRIHSNTI